MLFVQVTNLVELARVKCHQYYPESGSLTFGPVTITLLESIPLADFTIRSLKLEMVSHYSPRIICHTIAKTGGIRSRDKIMRYFTQLVFMFN